MYRISDVVCREWVQSYCTVPRPSTCNQSQTKSRLSLVLQSSIHLQWATSKHPIASQPPSCWLMLLDVASVGSWRPWRVRLRGGAETVERVGDLLLTLNIACAETPYLYLCTAHAHYRGETIIGYHCAIDNDILVGRHETAHVPSSQRPPSFIITPITAVYVQIERCLDPAASYRGAVQQR